MFKLFYLYPSVTIFIAIAVALGFIVWHAITQKNEWWAILLTIFASGFIPLAAILVIIIGGVCNRKVAYAFDTFNPHLIELCFHQNLGQCPRSEGAIEAFNPDLFNEIQRCTETRFQFNQVNNTALWSVRLDKTILVSGLTEQGAAAFGLDEAKEKGYWE